MPGRFKRCHYSRNFKNDSTSPLVYILTLYFQQREWRPRPESRVIFVTYYVRRRSILNSLVVGGRLDAWVHMSYNNQEIPLLPYGHAFSRLYATHVHLKGHHGISTTVSKVRARYWITGVHMMVKSIKHNCVTCKKLDRKLTTQEMGKLPIERLKPSPPWYWYYWYLVLLLLLWC